jgi:hypothetical protein
MGHAWPTRGMELIVAQISTDVDRSAAEAPAAGTRHVLDMIPARPDAYGPWKYPS